MQTHWNHPQKTRKYPRLVREKAVVRGEEAKPTQTVEEMVAKEWVEERAKDKVAVRDRVEGKADEVGSNKAGEEFLRRHQYL